MESPTPRKQLKVASGQGGWRPGAGRKPNSTNRMSAEAREKARLTGLLPHEILLSIARGEPQEEIDVEAETGRQTTRLVPISVERRLDAAKAAAPYYAPKISTVEVISGVGDHDLDQLITQLASEAGVSLSASGESPQGEGTEKPRDRVKLKS